jgi:hypothetical protein
MLVLQREYGLKFVLSRVRQLRGMEFIGLHNRHILIIEAVWRWG